MPSTVIGHQIGLESPLSKSRHSRQGLEPSTKPDSTAIIEPLEYGGEQRSKDFNGYLGMRWPGWSPAQKAFVGCDLSRVHRHLEGKHARGTDGPQNKKDKPDRAQQQFAKETSSWNGSRQDGFPVNDSMLVAELTVDDAKK